MPISVASPRRLAGLAGPLRALVRVALALEERRAGEIAIVLTDDATLRELNHRYRGIDRATDVLSFDYDAEAGAGARARLPASVSGDIVISLERMDEQARRFRVSRGRELARLVVHGVLHLAGCDHQRAAERRHMRARERAALRSTAAVISSLERALGRGGFLSAPARQGR